MKIDAESAIENALADLRYAIFRRRTFADCSKRKGTRERDLLAAKHNRAALRRTCALIRLARVGAGR